jgi:hypothetical protein
MKGERNAQVYQVGPHLFGTSSTIPHWKTEELIPSLKPFLLSLDTYKEKELKIAFSLAIQPESETQKTMQNIAHSSSSNGKVPRAGSA